MNLVEDVYRYTAVFPDVERFGLIAQMRRSAVSVPSNIAEGAGRNGDKELINFLGIARGSLSELETQIQLSKRLGYIDEEPSNLNERLDNLFALIGGLMNSIRKRTGQ